MIDIRSFNASLKTKWVQSYLNTENKGKWKAFFDYYLERYGGKLLFLCNLKQKDAITAENKRPFYTSPTQIIVRGTQILSQHVSSITP